MRHAAVHCTVARRLEPILSRPASTSINLLCTQPPPTCTTAMKMIVASSCMIQLPNSLIDMDSRKSTSSVSWTGRGLSSLRSALKAAAAAAAAG